MNHARLVRTRSRSRRGVALVVLVVALALSGLAVAGAVSAAAADSRVAAFRLDTVRAFYAAEAATWAVARSSSEGQALPDVGDAIDLTGASASFVQVPDPSIGGDVVVEARSGASVRRLRVTFTPPD